MLSAEEYPEVPSSSGASFRSVGGDDAAPTPRRTGSPTPARHVDERSKLLNRSEGDDYVGYSADQAERVERRRRTSSYTVINTTTTSGVGSAIVPGANDDDVGRCSI